MDNELYIRIAHDATMEYIRQKGQSNIRHDEFVKDYVSMVGKTVTLLKQRLDEPE